MTSTNFAYPQPTDDELAAQMSADDHFPNHPNRSGPSGSVPASGPGGAVSDSAAASWAGTGAPDAGAASSGPGALSPRLGKAALILSIIAAGLSLIASAILGSTVGPMEAASGYYFSDLPSWYTGIAVGLFSVQGLCAVLGLTGLVMGIVATATGRGRTQGILAIAIAVFAPVISFALFVILSFALA
ncbi:hypothetical protein M3G54_02270 [Brevibacterium casei]|uniref:hypothetical protein n=1 Tax=Brevibacterium casei TaxID=33889 RepID=UPI00223C01F5|nr:hypothetical protein [Brevibacterium casei]MCT2357190.1 hypothetical protein [Brevibacterium casei]